MKFPMYDCLIILQPGTPPHHYGEQLLQLPFVPTVGLMFGRQDRPCTVTAVRWSCSEQRFFVSVTTTHDPGLVMADLLKERDRQQQAQESRRCP